jgi:hypothetical protein
MSDVWYQRSVRFKVADVEAQGITVEAVRERLAVLAGGDTVWATMEDADGVVTVAVRTTVEGALPREEALLEATAAVGMRLYLLFSPPPIHGRAGSGLAQQVAGSLREAPTRIGWTPRPVRSPN